MQPIFQHHPLVRQFNQLKLEFRLHETDSSKMRIKEFRRLARGVQNAGLFVGFDLLGSLNFGQSTEQSDVDAVLYLICHDHKDECEEKTCKQVQIITSELQKSSGLSIHLVDCINLAYLDSCLENNVAEPIVSRFAFYRSICRSINARLLRPFQLQLKSSGEMLKQISPEVESFFDELTRSSTHNLSFGKYLARMGDSDIKIPISLLKKIYEYLNYKIEPEK